jgi:branched-chain amino acid transport system permease protein
MAVRDNELAAAPAGINVTLYKATIFGISALYAGVAGGLAGLRTDFIGPDTYGLFFSIQLLVGAVAGGLHSVWGAVFGGLLIQFLPDLAADASGIMSFPAYGLILIALVYLLPSGFAGALQRAGSWAAARLRR